MAEQGMDAVLEKLQSGGKRKTVLKRKRVRDGVPSRGPGAPRKKGGVEKEGKGGMTVIIGLNAPKKPLGGPIGSPMRDKMGSSDDRIAMLEAKIDRLEAMLAKYEGEDEDMDENEDEYEDED